MEDAPAGMMNGIMLKYRATLVLMLSLLPLGCRKPPDREPMVGRCREIIEWLSPYGSEPVEESLDGKWEAIGDPPGVYRAVLAEKVAVSNGRLEASATRGGKGVPLRSATSVESLNPGEFMMVPAIEHSLPLSGSLTNNGKESCSIVLPRGPVQIAVRANGKSAVGIAPHMLLHWNGEVIKEFDVAATRYEPYIAGAVAKDGTNVLDIEFNNDYWKPPEDRNLYLNQVSFSQPGMVSVKVSDSKAGPPESVRIRYRPCPWFVNEYRTAEPVPGLSAGGERWRYYTVDEDTRPAVPLPAPGRAVIEIPYVGERIVLAFGLIKTGFEWKDEVITYEVRFESGKKVLWSDKIVLSPMNAVADRSWVDRDYYVGGFGETPVRLSVSTSSSLGEKADSGSLEEGRHLPLAAQPLLLGRPPEGPRSQNVILISLDALRGDHLGSLGYRRDTSPYLDRFGEENFNFTDASAQSSWTVPSHIAMLASLYPSTHGVFEKNESIRNVSTLASVLAEHSYRTKAFVDGGFMRPQYGLCHGFDSYECLELQGFSKILPSCEKWIRENRNDPFFLFLHTFDTHDPYRLPEEYRNLYPVPDGVSSEFVRGFPHELMQLKRKVKSVRVNPAEVEYAVNLYDAGIRYADDQIKRLFDLLRELDLWDHTIIVVTADHGDEFLEHGGFGHGKSLYQEILHVPLMIRAPTIEGRGRVDSLVKTIDIVPTVLELLGIKPSIIPQGDSLLPLLRGIPTSPRPAFAEDKNCVVYRTGNLKFFYRENSRDRTELYDLEKDPGENTNLVSKEADLVNRLTEEVKAFRQRNRAMGENIGSESTEFSGELLDELANLGYVGR